jgi:DNA-3-methyladenine glycosylase II
LRRPDVLPGGDLGIRTAIRNVYELAALPTSKEVDRIGAPWRPYATVASWYLWRSLDNEAAL